MTAPPSDQIADAVAWVMSALAANAVYAACAALAIFGMLRLFRVRRPSVHFLGWSLVLLRMILPPDLATTFSLRSALERTWQWVSAGATTGSDVAAYGATWVPAVGDATSPATGSFVSWTGAAFLVWLAGSVLVAFVLVRRFRWYGRLAHAATEVSRPEVVTLANAWRDRFHVTRPVRVVSSDCCLTPFASGLFSPVVFLPEVMLGWSDAALEPVIAHEMAHVARLDELWTVLANVVRAVHFWNPLAWVAVDRLAANRELVCDERVLGAGGVAPDRYARSMVGAMQINMFGTAHADLVLGLVDRKKGVAMRLQRMQSMVRLRPLKPMTLAVGVMAALLFVLPMGAGDARPGPSMTASAPLEEPPGQPGSTGDPEIFSEVDGRPVDRVVVGGPETEPKKFSGPTPEYTSEARAARIQGVVVARTLISEQGEVMETTVLRGLPLGLTEAAVAAISKWEFEPAWLEGEPVAAAHIVTVRFELDDSDGTSNRTSIEFTGDDPTAADLQRIRDLLASTLGREIFGDVRLVRIVVGGRQLMIEAVAPDRGGIDAFVSRLRANPGFDEVELGGIDDRDDGTVAAAISLVVVTEG